MAPDEETTQVAPSTESPLSALQNSSAAPDPAAAATDGALQDGAETQDGGPAGAEDDSPPPWSEVRKVEDLLASEHVAPAIEKARQEAKDETKAEWSKRLQPLISRQSLAAQELSTRQQRIGQNLDTLVANLNKANAAHEIDETTAAALTQFFTDHQQDLAALSPAINRHNLWSGFLGLVDGLGRAIEKPEDPSKLSALCESYFERIKLAEYKGTIDSDPTLIPDLLEEITSDATKKLRDENAALKATVTRMETEARDAGRNGTSAPAKVTAKGGGGGKNDTDEARLHRLANEGMLGVDPPTQADREWLAAKN